MNKTVIAVIVVVVVVVLVIVFTSGGDETAEAPPAGGGGGVVMPAGGARTGQQPQVQVPQMSEKGLEELAGSVPKADWSKLPEWQRKQLEAWDAAQGE